MLHHSILPNAKTWGHFLSKLKYVVVDGKVKEIQQFDPHSISI
jgi:hypothetical protein